MKPDYCGTCWKRNASNDGDTAAVTKPCRKCWRVKKPKEEGTIQARAYGEQAIATRR